MARGEVFISDAQCTRLWKTDLTGHGTVRVGEEFTIRELCQWGRGGLVKGGIKRRVRVVGVSGPPSFQVLTVEVLEDLTPMPMQKRSLFD